MSRVWCLGIVSLFICSHQVQAQDDAYLSQLVTAVKSLRTGNGKNCEKVAWQIGDKRMPKITLLDNLGKGDHELTGKDVYAFRLNKVVAWAYQNQNNKLVTPGRYFNSNETGIAYSAIEKTLKSGSTSEYHLSGHQGVQEMAVVAFHPTTLFTLVVSVNGRVVKNATAKDLVCVKTPSLKKQDVVTIKLSMPANISGGKESVAVIICNEGAKK